MYKPETQQLLDLLSVHGHNESDPLDTNPTDLAMEIECSTTEIYSAIRYLISINRIGAISDDFGLVGLFEVELNQKLKY